MAGSHRRAEENVSVINIECILNKQFISIQALIIIEIHTKGWEGRIHSHKK